MGCGWQSLEQAARNYSLKFLASSVDCIERTAPPQTSDIRYALSPFAMLISSQATSDASAIIRRDKRLCNSFL